MKKLFLKLIQGVHNLTKAKFPVDNALTFSWLKNQISSTHI